MRTSKLIVMALAATSVFSAAIGPVQAQEFDMSDENIKLWIMQQIGPNCDPSYNSNFYRITSVDILGVYTDEKRANIYFKALLGAPLGQGQNRCEGKTHSDSISLVRLRDGGWFVPNYSVRIK